MDRLPMLSPISSILNCLVLLCCCALSVLAQPSAIPAKPIATENSIVEATARLAIEKMANPFKSVQMVNAFAIEHTLGPVIDDKTGEGLRVWQMTGPFGGDVTALAIDPRNADVILAGTNDGQLFRSTNGGQIWRRLRPGLKVNGYAVTVILFDRERAGTCFVGVKQTKDINDDATGGGLFVTRDNGTTWTEFEPLRNRSIRGLVQASADRNVLIAVARDGIYRTLDHGLTWKRITPERDRELTGFHSAAIDPRNVDQIYVGTWHLPWKTFDGGVTWRLAGMKDTGMVDDSDIFCIQIDETAPDAMWMSACSGIYRSTDGSVNWAKIKGIPFTARRTPAIFQHPTRPDLVFAGTIEGLWRSNKGGRDNTWNRVTTRIGINAIAVHPQRPERIIVATEHYGMLVSDDFGETFGLSNAGFISRQVTAVLADQQERGRIYAGVIFDSANGGLYVSENGGLTWQQSMEGMGVRDVYSLFQSPTKASTIYAGTNQGLFRSDNHGRAWTAVKKVEPQPDPLITQAVNEPPTGRKSPATKRPPIKPALPPSDRLLDERVNLQDQVYALASLQPQALPNIETPATPYLLAVTWDGLYRTEDETRGWKLLKPTPTLANNLSADTSGGITNGEPIGQNLALHHGIKALATSPQAPGLVLLGTEKGLLLSRDNGETFKAVSLSEKTGYRIRTIQFDPRTANTIYVGTTEGFFRSLDSGATWEHRGGGMPMVVDITAICINPMQPDELYVADDLRGGFYRSPDRGKNWEALDISKLPSPRFQTIVADPYTPNRLYVGSFSGGVYVVNRK